MKRGTGVLCHISSLPGKYGIGSFGKEAYRFAKLLAKNGVKYWQVLPLVQTGFGDSPYQSVSCTSGNPYFIDLEALAREGLFKKKELKTLRKKGPVDYGALYAERYSTLRLAFSRYDVKNKNFLSFIKSGTDDYALFMTAKTVYGGLFCDWQEDLMFHRPEALEKLRSEHREEYLFWQFVQFQFSRQWKKLKAYCNELGIKIIGDIPLYVAYDSADVWANPNLFKLDGQLKADKIAGVPPDYFSETGQLWGNPVYNWSEHEKDGYRWWKKRLNHALETYDLVRIDHFRGIDRYYEIPSDSSTAEGGQWKNGPKEKLFEGIKKRDRIIAEDLGIVDDSVRSLLARTGFPGMKVLLFAFDGNPENPFLPHNYSGNCVVYTGTHDNDTVTGFVKSLSTEEFILFRSRVAAELKEMNIWVQLGENPQSFARAFIEMALKSKADLAVIPVQDIIEADNSCRMNYPGAQNGNWRFRLNKFPSAKKMRRLKKFIKKYRR